MELTELAKAFGPRAPEVLTWPNSSQETKIGQQRFASIPPSLRRSVERFRREVMELRRRRSDRRYVYAPSLRTRLAEFKRNNILRKRERLEAERIPLNLFRNRTLQNVAKRYGFDLVEEGTWRQRRYWQTTGRQIREEDLDRWREVYLSAEVQASIAKAERARERREKRWERRCDALGIYDPKGRTARAVRAGVIEDYTARLIAFKTKYRHEHTDYESQYRNGDYQQLRAAGFSMEEAQREMRSDARMNMAEDDLPSDWATYLAHYDFTGPIAEAMASVLKDPKKCHPVWFCACMLGLEKYGMPEGELTYDQIAAAKLSTWED